MQATLILSYFGANYERIDARPTRSESGHATSFIIFCRHYCALCRVRSTGNHLAGVQGIGFREPAGTHLLQWLNFLYYLWHYKWCALFHPHRIPTFVGSIHLGHLGAYQSSACGPGRQIPRIPARNQILANELIPPAAACADIAPPKPKQSMVCRIAAHYRRDGVH
jgi:hypothetical protein